MLSYIILMRRCFGGVSHQQCDSHRAHAARHGRYCAGYFADAFKIDIAAELAVFVPVHADINDRRAGLHHIRGYHLRPADRRDKNIYSGQDVKMLFVLAKQRQAPIIFRMISEIDPHAFVSQSAVIGVYGNGFDEFKYKAKKEHGV